MCSLCLRIYVFSFFVFYLSVSRSLRDASIRCDTFGSYTSVREAYDIRQLHTSLPRK